MVDHVGLDVEAGGAFCRDARTPSCRARCAPVLQTGVIASRRMLQGRCRGSAVAPVCRVLVVFWASLRVLSGVVSRIVIQLLAQTLLAHDIGHETSRVFRCIDVSSAPLSDAPVFGRCPA